MRLALIADTFPPLRTSGAVQLRDLAREFVRQGHALTVLLPDYEQQEQWRLEAFDGAQVLRLKAPKIKDIGYVRRTLAELAMPFSMLRHFRESPLSGTRWDGVIWYSPSIFHAPFARYLKVSSGCIGYLIIRDIFPEWAVDMGLMGRGLPYRFFDVIAYYQYSVADVIGIQTPGNGAYFRDWAQRPGRSLEVLQNWLDAPPVERCSIRVANTPLAGRKVLVYAGNMGIAQGMDVILDLATHLAKRRDLGFLFVGRGSEASRLRDLALARCLDNVVFANEIHPDEIPDLYSQCSAGIVALDTRHKSHNIPGKFLTYMQSGLPVLAKINAGNDLASIIRTEKVGQVCESDDLNELIQLTDMLLRQIDEDSAISERCTTLFDREFSVRQAVKQIVSSLSSKNVPPDTADRTSDDK